MNKKIAVPMAVALLATLVAAAVLYNTSTVDVTINEALSTVNTSLAFSGFPNETISRNIVVHNAGSNPLNSRFTWSQDQNVNGVVYTTNLPMNQSMLPGDNNVTVSFTIAPDSPVGSYNGTVSLNRVN